MLPKCFWCITCSNSELKMTSFYLFLFCFPYWLLFQPNYIHKRTDTRIPFSPRPTLCTHMLHMALLCIIIKRTKYISKGWNYRMVIMEMMMLLSNLNPAVLSLSLSVGHEYYMCVHIAVVGRSFSTFLSSLV